MAQEIIEETGKNVATFMGDFTTQYIATIIQSKLDDKISQAVQAVFPAEIADKLLGGGDEGNDEEKEEEKEDRPSIASGVAVVGYRTAEGPDKIDHRYYDFSCWNIKTKDSIITKVTKKHRDLLDFSIQVTKDIPDAPKIQFPGKKRFGKKDDDYYRQRFDLIRAYFKAMNEDQKVSTSDLFLKFFHLKADPDREALLGLFMNTLQSICEKESIDWNSAVDRARRLGIDLDEAEMLKVIAIVKVGGPATEKLQQVVRENTPAFLPGNVTNRFVSKADLKLASAIATSVENGWKAAGDSFNQIVSTLNDTLEKASAPLMDVFTKAAQPVGDVVKKAFAKGQSKMEVNDGLDRKITSRRFPLLKEFFENVESGAFEARLKLYKSLDKLDEVYKYINFVRYNLGNPEWAEWVPFLNDLQDNHYRLTIALVDVAHILARGGIAAFAPLLKYVDEAAQNFDEKTHQEKLQNAVRTGGKHLARQYFALEDDIRRCLWTCGYSSTEKVTQLARQTIYKEADLLGQVAHKWKPTNNGDARKTFVTVLEKRLDKFLSWAVQSWVSTIRDSTQDQIADLFERMSGDAIKELCSTLDEAFSALPDPLNKYLKPGKIISSLLHKMVVNASVIVVKEMAKSTEKRLYDVNCIEVDAADENEVWRLRWSPYIRKEEELGEAEEEPIIEKPEKKTEENVDSNQEEQGQEQDGNKEEEQQPGTEG